MTWFAKSVVLAAAVATAAAAQEYNLCWSQCHSLSMLDYDYYGGDMEIATGVFEWCMDQPCESDGVQLY